MGKVLDGKAIAERIKGELVQELRRLGIVPQLRILYFETPASRVYWQAQNRVAAELGIGTGTGATEERGSVACPWDVTPARAEQIIDRWNRDPEVHGIFVHQPMPPQIDPGRISSLIDPRKDVEGIHPQNSARRFFA